MWANFFCVVTDHVFDRQTNRQTPFSWLLLTDIPSSTVNTGTETANAFDNFFILVQMMSGWQIGITLLL